MEEIIHSFFNHFTKIALQLSLSNLEPLLKTEGILASFNLSGKLPLVKESLTKNAKGLMCSL